MAPQRDAPRAARLLIGPASSAAAVLAATAVVAVVDPHEPGSYPVCPFLALTGYPCPLCGGLRAVNSLTSGDVAAAVGSNILVVVGLVGAVVLWARWTMRRARGSPASYVDPSPPIVVAGLVVLVVFGIVRNLPFAAVLAP